MKKSIFLTLLVMMAFYNNFAHAKIVHGYKCTAVNIENIQQYTEAFAILEKTAYEESLKECNRLYKNCANLGCHWAVFTQDDE